MSFPADVVVIGVGLPGLATVLALSTRYPETQITVLAQKDGLAELQDQSSEFFDAFLVQGDSENPTYLSLSLEAQARLKGDPELSRSVHVPGLIRARGPGGNVHSEAWERKRSVVEYLELKSKHEDSHLPTDRLEILMSPDAILRHFASTDSPAPPDGIWWQKGYFDKAGTIMDMRATTRVVYQRCLKQPNVKFALDSPVQRLTIENRCVSGVVLQDGSTKTARTVILAEGPHSNLLVNLESNIKVTGHDVAWLRPAASIAAEYQGMPLLNNLSAGLTLFPPVNGEFNCALDSSGYTNTAQIVDPVSGDKVRVSVPEECSWETPPAAEREMRTILSHILPKLADSPLSRSSLEWRVNANNHGCLIDYHPEVDNLFVMIPSTEHIPLSIILGQKAVERIEGRLPTSLLRQWTFSQPDSVNGVHELKYSKPIAIIGAGVFGLTSALHLARRGYRNITLFDREAYDKDGYCSAAASADQNKIIRASYGAQKLYQDLAFEALDVWEEWNCQVRTATDLPSTLSSSDCLWDNCGFLRAGETEGLDAQEIATQENLPARLKRTQYRVGGKEHASKDGILSSKLDPFDRAKRELGFDGIFDGTGGYVAADKCCSWVLHLCQQLGVRTKLGTQHAFRDFIRHGKSIRGIQIRDGTQHSADLVIVAAGGWTPSLVPEVADLLQTTAGSTVKIQLPATRPDLWDKYSSSRLPCWSWRLRGSPLVGTEVGGIYGFPCTAAGVIKIGFRGVKWTNRTFSNTQGRVVSYPQTDSVGIPQRAMQAIRGFCDENMPDIAGLPFSTRLCWYTDSVDSSFLIDRVPDAPGLMVASGGSGHGFKFLPVLGKHVADVVENKKTGYTRLFQWRDPPASGQNEHFNSPSDRWPSLGDDELSKE